MPRETFLIVDGNSLMHRAYHALPPMDFEGTPTNAVHGFLMMLFKVFETRRPHYCAVAFDEHAPTFRHQAYAEYKAGRQKTPDDLVSQFHLIRELLPKLHVPVYACAGWEADDILGTVGAINSGRGVDTVLLTGDRDALQL
ncbi:MAG: DNA polymerase I, partial [Clostridia bacterium]|nr:DNA polymerase I [Clostridia bacterium]